ncbi:MULTISPECIES: mechanosensitive ion channel family protein [unclassified Methylophaga]|uniref:mechanosensitive ion channel family protein n=1 Tax=unclassified Methylophaga TaxID=2629249 RepID=UPI000C9490EF|nr:MULTISPECIES: mechanosensitive ion channel family protein [unclassified Methylophaga]MAK67213.1 mechanosensitive ion channel protein MscS [Methylophaga sp.]MAY18251.1 mechanosensitive ion channel protein MscS [Methylophaga sp.]HCD04666.1 mechanosensitive ion channel protein MscS [Methylophaga sp.]
MESYNLITEWLENYPHLYTLIGLSVLILVSWIANWLVKRILVRGVYRILRNTQLGRYSSLADSSFIRRMANIVPALILSAGIVIIPNISPVAVAVVQNVTTAFIVLTIALGIGSLLTIINDAYNKRPDAHLKPIKGYIQVLKIAIYAIAAILMIASLIDRSPLILLSGLGAMAAVLLLIFQDTLLSLVASVQISSNDLIRVGDWIEMTPLNADGDVIDIALHTVKVQNWDKTISVIPTKRFLTDPFKNWRGMQESGGRRIKRSILIDQQSIHFLSNDERKKLHRFSLMDEYLHQKQKDIDEWNQQLAEWGKEPVNTRRITNIGSFRAYVSNYLKNHPKVHQNYTLMSRQLEPTANGLPLEIYCFTNTTNWIEYEGIASDIFDHLLAILPEFGLRVFQQPSGFDMRELRLQSLPKQDPEISPALGDSPNK